VEGLGCGVDGLNINLNFMNDWLTKQIPVYKVYLGWVAILLLLVILGSIFSPFPHRISKAKAEIVKTRSDEQLLVALIKNQAIEINLLTNLNNEFVLSSISAQDQFWIKTNNSGAVIDIWGTPYRMSLAPKTNFIIHSAGPNCKFSDKDDIIFNSVSNDFVKP
jgi:hypothetical protein